MSDLIGQTLGQCRIERRLGQGGMGEVFYGRHLTLDLEVAVKILPPQLSANTDFVARFYREAREAAKLDHPNIVRVINVSEENGQHFLVMQFIDGPSLRDVLKTHGALPVAVATTHAVQALSGLEYAHRRGVVHRDIKPDNLMLTPDGVLKITDFGLARGIAAGDSQLTRTGEVMGTPAYMPMEQWEGAEIDHRADLYAMGVTLYQLIAGAVPFRGETPAVIVRQLALGETIPLAEAAPGTDAELIAVVEKLMARDRDDRFFTAAEAIHALLAWQQSAGISHANFATGTGVSAPITLMSIPPAARPAAATHPAQSPTMTAVADDEELAPTIVSPSKRPTKRPKSAAPVADANAPKRRDSARQATSSAAAAGAANGRSERRAKPGAVAKRAPAPAAESARQKKQPSPSKSAPPAAKSTPARLPLPLLAAVLGISAVLLGGVAVAIMMGRPAPATNDSLVASGHPNDATTTLPPAATTIFDHVATTTGTTNGTGTDSGAGANQPDAEAAGLEAQRQKAEQQRAVRLAELTQQVERFARAVEQNDMEVVRDCFDIVALRRAIEAALPTAPEARINAILLMRATTIAAAIRAVESVRVIQVELDADDETSTTGTATAEMRGRLIPTETLVTHWRWHPTSETETEIGRWLVEIGTNDPLGEGNAEHPGPPRPPRNPFSSDRHRPPGPERPDRPHDPRRPR